MNEIELLRGTELFARLSDDELQSVARCIGAREVEAGTPVIREGQPGDSLYLVREGRVAVEKGEPPRVLRLAELGPGAAFGEMALIDNVATSATVRALTPASFLVISRLDLDVLLNWDTVLGSKMWRSFTAMLSRRLRATNERLAASGGELEKELLATTSDVELR